MISKLDIIPYCPKKGNILEVGSCTGSTAFLLEYNNDKILFK